MGLVRLSLDGLHVLHVGGHDHTGDRPLALGDPDRAVDQVADARRLVCLLAERRGDVAVELHQVDLLLEVPAERPDKRLTDDRHDRLMVELRVVEPVQQVDRARPRGRHADADLASELGVAAGHERCHLLMSGLHEPQLILVAPQGAEDAVDAVAGETVDRVHVPRDQSLTQVVCCGLPRPLPPFEFARLSPVHPRRSEF